MNINEKNLVFGTASASKGHKAYGQLCINQSIRIPVAVINGAKNGPHVVIIAGQHGLELNSVEAVRLFCGTVNPGKVKGSIFAVIAANPRAIMNKAQVWGEDGETNIPYNSKYNMNLNWPGKKDGMLVEQCTWQIFNQAILAPHAKTQLVVDMHSYENEIPTAAVYADDEEAVRLGIFSGVSSIVSTRNIPIMQQSPEKAVNMITLACRRRNIDSLVIELSGQNIITPTSVKDGYRILNNMMRSAGVLPGEPELPAEVIILDPWRDSFEKQRSFPSSIECSAETQGVFVPLVQPYEQVRKNQKLGHLISVETGRVVQEIRSPRSFAVYYLLRQSAACEKGTLLARLSDYHKIFPGKIKIR